MSAAHPPATVVIRTVDYQRIIAIANRLGYTPGGKNGTFADALTLIEVALAAARPGLGKGKVKP